MDWWLLTVSSSPATEVEDLQWTFLCRSGSGSINCLKNVVQCHFILKLVFLQSIMLARGVGIVELRDFGRVGH